MKKDYTLVLLIVLIVSQMAVSTLIISLSQRGQRERAKTQEYTLQVKEESSSIKCLLLVPKDTRTPDDITKCDAQAKAQVKQERQ